MNQQTPLPQYQQQQQQQHQQQQQQQQQPVRRPSAYGGGGSSFANPDELHMSAGLGPAHHPMAPRDYSSSSSSAQHQSPIPSQLSSFQSTPGVHNVLQPGTAAGARPLTMSAHTTQVASSSHMQPPQQSDPQQQHQQQQHQQQQSTYQTPSKPAALSLNSSHGYSRSSPAATGHYDGSAPPGSASYIPYTPTTPGAASSQYMSPTESKYSAPGSQRNNLSHTPLGLADIRPRADSSLSDSLSGPLGHELASQQAGTSNYLAPWALYAFDWCKWPPQAPGAGKLAVGSYLEDGHNFIQILDTQLGPTPSDAYVPGGSTWTMDFTRIAEATHSYPVTRLLWEPPSSQKQTTDLLATSGDHLRLWSLPADASATPQAGGSNSVSSRNGMRDPSTPGLTKLTPLALLSNSKTPDHTAPLTSLDWNMVQPSLIITSSIDTTCTIWDIPSLTAKTQLIAHDKEVYDVRFCAQSVDVFVSCGQDGSVRMFDLRSLEHSTIIYEPTGKDERDAAGGRMSPTTAQQTMTHPPPLLRLATSPHDQHLLATFAQDSNVVRILDVRQPGQALLELRGHGGALNCIEWSPLRRGTLASGGDDCQVLLWDLLNSSTIISQPPQVQQMNSIMNGGAGGPQSQPGHSSSQPGQQPQPAEPNVRGPVAAWQCDYEVGNLGWSPRFSGSEYGEWLSVAAGRGVWGVRLG